MPLTPEQERYMRDGGWTSSTRYDDEYYNSGQAARDQGTTRTVFEEEIDPSLLMGDSAAAGAQGDPTSIAYQQQVLDQLGRSAARASRGEMTDAEQAEYDQYAALGNVAAQGAREGSLQQRQARGQGGEDVNLLYAQMGQQQDVTNRAAMDAQHQQDLAARAREMQAAYSQLARGMRGQSFDENYARGAAQDQASWFDADYQRTVNNRNVERQHDQSSADAEGRQRDWANRARYFTGGAGESARSALQNFGDQRERERAGYGMAQDLVDIGGGIVSAYTGGGLSGGLGGLGGEDDDDEDY